MRCPKCNLLIGFDREAFRRDFTCKQCGVKLVVSQTYSRMLVLLSLVFGFGLPWVAQFQKFLIPALGPLVGFIAILAMGFPLAFAILFLLVRTLPHLVPPSLVPSNNEGTIRLNLNEEQERN